MNPGWHERQIEQIIIKLAVLIVNQVVKCRTQVKLYKMVNSSISIITCHTSRSAAYTSDVLAMDPTLDLVRASAQKIKSVLKADFLSVL